MDGPESSNIKYHDSDVQLKWTGSGGEDGPLEEDQAVSWIHQVLRAQLSADAPVPLVTAHEAEGWNVDLSTTVDQRPGETWSPPEAPQRSTELT